MAGAIGGILKPGGLGKGELVIIGPLTALGKGLVVDGVAVAPPSIFAAFFFAVFFPEVAMGLP
jgi:hypothetical protein